MWGHVGATLRIRLNRPYAAAMWPYVKLLDHLFSLLLLLLYYSFLYNFVIVVTRARLRSVVPHKLCSFAVSSQSRLELLVVVDPI